MQPRSRSEVWALLPAELSIIDNTENNMASIITIKHRHRRHIPTIRQDKDLPVNKVNRVEMNGRNRNRTMKTTTFSIKMLEMARMTTTKPVQNSIRVKTNSSNLSVHTGAAIPIKWTRNTSELHLICQAFQHEQWRLTINGLVVPKNKSPRNE